MKMKPTTSDVAAWMLRQVSKGTGVLEQEDAAMRIEAKFGARFIQTSDRGGMSIHPDVLAEFRTLSEETVVWDRTQRAWRLREAGDGSKRLAE